MELLLPRKFVPAATKAIATRMVSFLLYSSFFFSIFLVSFMNLMMESMAAEDTLQAIEFVLGEKDLMRIREEFDFLMSIRLELLSPSKRISSRMVTRVALDEEACKAMLRLSLSTIIIELLQWYQVVPPSWSSMHGG